MAHLAKRCTSVAFFALAICGLRADGILANDLQQAELLRLKGQYQEATEAFQKLSKAAPIASALGISRCQRLQGQLDAAEASLGAAIQDHANNADMHAEFAELRFTRGDYDTARQQVDLTLGLNRDHLLARWIDAELLRSTGKLEKANEAYRWFVRYYNQHQREIKTPRDVRLIGLAASQYARWNRNSEQFSFLVNRLYPKALKLNENYWPARLESGLLFLEKYNDSDATTDLNAALAINPNAAEVHAARALMALQNFDLDAAKTSIDRALELNPNLLEAHHYLADFLMANFRLPEAIKELEKTRRLNPLHAETLGRLAAVYGTIDGLRKEDDDSRMDELISAEIVRNENCGEFFFALASTLELLRKYPHAAKYYEQAQRRMPQLVGVRGRLGLMYMRLGEEVKAAKLMNESFEIDPFNLRIKNMLAVLELLEKYAVLETEHFIIKFDRGRDDILAQYAARYLEDEVYPEIVDKLGYKPKGKSLFEIFSRSGRTSGHSWFSARMVGLPYVGTVGACAGKMVALASPNDMPTPYNWARVLKHEFVHVVNLQQTDFNIPHWYTEALAVLNEGYPRPPQWNQILAKRVAEKRLFNLDTINLGFLRPGAGDDWTLAYCQAELYAEYMLKEFGDDALSKLLRAYADNPSTREAITHCFAISQEEFEAGYLKFLSEVVADLKVKPPPTGRTLSELQKFLQENPRDADALAETALAYLNRKSNTRARRFADAARKVEEGHQLASYVVARLYLSIGDVDPAMKLLEETLDEEQPQVNHLGLLAGLKLRAEQHDEAERLYLLGADKHPHASKWLKALVRVYLGSDDEKLAEVLRKLAELETDNVTIRKKLAQLALDAKRFNEAAGWANQAVQINVMDGEVHAMLAAAYRGLKNPLRSLSAAETAVRIAPDRIEWQVELARTYIEAEQTNKAKSILKKILRLEPDHAVAQKMLESLNP